MPYTKIHWIKLEIRLLNDPRFFLISEKAQLLYLKLLLGLGQSGGKVSLNWSILGQVLRLNWKEDEFKVAFAEIKSNFPKVIINNGFIAIKDFKNKHNFLSNTELQGNSHGTPKDAEDKIREVSKSRIDLVVRELIEAQGWLISDNPLLLTDIYKRHGRSAKKLLQLVDDEKVINAIKRMAGEYKRKGLSWTLETVIKHLPELLQEEKPQIKYA